eukprot:1150563-Rhodomonas_salina.1
MMSTAYNAPHHSSWERWQANHGMDERKPFHPSAYPPNFHGGFDMMVPLASDYHHSMHSGYDSQH